MSAEKIKAEDIRSFDVTPSWERAEPERQGPGPQIHGDYGCACGLCQLAAADHL